MCWTMPTEPPVSGNEKNRRLATQRVPGRSLHTTSNACGVRAAGKCFYRLQHAGDGVRGGTLVLAEVQAAQGIAAERIFQIPLVAMRA